MSNSERTVPERRIESKQRGGNNIKQHKTQFKSIIELMKYYNTIQFKEQTPGNEKDNKNVE